MKLWLIAFAFLGLSVLCCVAIAREGPKLPPVAPSTSGPVPTLEVGKRYHFKFPGADPQMGDVVEEQRGNWVKLKFKNGGDEVPWYTFWVNVNHAYYIRPEPR